MVLTTIPTVFKDVYHERVGIAGLNYISLGIGEYAHTDNFPLGIWLKCALAGLVVATQVNARALDRVYKHLKARNGGIGQPEFRLSTSLGGLVLAERLAYTIVSHRVPWYGRGTRGPAYGWMGDAHALDSR